MAIEDLGRSISDGRKAVGEIREVVAAITGVVESHLVAQLSDAVNELDLYLLPDAESAHAYIQELKETELYVLMSELAETNEKAVRWKIIFGESIRENGKIVADSFNAAELQDDHDFNR